MRPINKIISRYWDNLKADKIFLMSIIIILQNDLILMFQIYIYMNSEYKAVHLIVVKSYQMTIKSIECP